jgi:hypothetical protein
MMKGTRLDMEQWQKRVVKEKNDLDDKLERLIIFIASKKFSSIPNEEQKRLRRQEIFMELYSDVLADGIVNFEY